MSNSRITRLSNLKKQLSEIKAPAYPEKYWPLIKSWVVKAIPTIRNIPIRMIWVYPDTPDGPNQCCRTLYIKADKYFPYVSGPQFEPSRTYHLVITGLLLKKPVDIEFHTPAPKQ